MQTEILFDSKVQELDLSLIVKRLQKKLQWNASRTDLAVFEYRQFLQLLLDTPNTLHTPLSADMDEVWHMHILFTKKYAEDCKKIFGFFLHHSPHVDKLDMPANACYSTCVMAKEDMCCDEGDCQPSN